MKSSPLRQGAIRLFLSIFLAVAILPAPLWATGGDSHTQTLPVAMRSYQPAAEGVCTPATSVLTQHNDNARTGANLNETILNTGNVNVQQFGKLFTRPVDGEIYAQPLVLCNVTLPGGGLHNIVYVATMHNTVYAFDADDPQASSPFWAASLGPALPLPDPNAGGLNYGDIHKEVGIVSTPVISLERQVIYVVATTKEGGAYFHRLHALDLTTGAERLGGPVVISGQVPGNGVGSQNGSVSFDSSHHLQRPGLLLANRRLYIAFGSYGDVDPYHGWIMAYDADTLGQTAIYNTTPNGAEASIWQSGQGLSADSDNFVYAISSNGSFRQDGSVLSNSVIKFNPALGVVDWFTPYNNLVLSQSDTDLGSTGAVLIPNSTLVIGIGKEGKLYVMDRSHLGHFNPANPGGGDHDGQIVQSFWINLGRPFFGSPVYWHGPGGPWIYLWGQADLLKAYRLSGGLFGTNPISQGQDGLPDSRTGGILSISANGGQAGTGILWRMTAGSALLAAYDASDLSRKLWDSNQNAARDGLNTVAKFAPPTVVNGKVYVATFSGSLAVYGLLPKPEI